MFNNDFDRIKNDPDYLKREIKKSEIGMFLSSNFMVGLLFFIWVSEDAAWNWNVFFIFIAVVAFVIFYLAVITIKSPLKVIYSFSSSWKKGLKHLTGL